MVCSLTPDGTLWIPVEEDTQEDEIKVIVICTEKWAKSYLPKEKIVVPGGILNEPKIIT